ncbi:hypothetical protein JQC79_22775 [Ochrobactrum anthropi]|nr:hypothetical protein [Brucella anthropi]MBM6398587.1 hypothetical protein [Brucella anthropi]
MSVLPAMASSTMVIVGKSVPPLVDALHDVSRGVYMSEGAMDLSLKRC